MATDRTQPGQSPFKAVMRGLPSCAESFLHSAGQVRGAGQKKSYEQATPSVLRLSPPWCEWTCLGCGASAKKLLADKQESRLRGPSKTAHGSHAQRPPSTARPPEPGRGKRLTKEGLIGPGGEGRAGHVVTDPTQPGLPLLRRRLSQTPNIIHPRGK